MRNKRWDPRYESIIKSYESELAEMFNTASNMKKIFLIKLTVALDQRIKGLLLNSPKYYKHEHVWLCIK